MKNLLIPTVCLFLLIHHADSAEPGRMAGDWTIKGEKTVRGEHIRLDGSLILPQGSELTLEDCTLEIIGDYSRHHAVEWKGGTLVTKNCTVGGFVNPKGTPIHTVFHLYEGLWEATDTIVQYSYGISFHWKEGKGILRGTRLKAGARPDAIILSGEAEVTLVDSQFPMGLGVYVNKGGSTTLDLTPGESVTATYDRASLLPGVNWRLSMTNTRVPRWFLFVRQIGGWQPPAEITLAGSKDLIVSLLGHNLTGQITLSKDLAQPLRVGNVTLKTSGGPAGIAMYAVYFSGDKTDVSITGKSHICELMHRGGKLQIAGEPGRPGISIGCTTLELSGNAQMDVRHVHLGRPLTWQDEGSMGEANVTGEAALVGRDITVRNVRFRTEDKGTVDLRNVERHGQIEARDNDGRIQIDEQRSTATTPKPDVSDSRVSSRLAGPERDTKASTANRAVLPTKPRLQRLAIRTRRTSRTISTISATLCSASWMCWASTVCITAAARSRSIVEHMARIRIRRQLPEFAERHLPRLVVTLGPKAIGPAHGVDAYVRQARVGAVLRV